MTTGKITSGRSRGRHGEMVSDGLREGEYHQQGESTTQVAKISGETPKAGS